jgi:rhamnogalacturonan endolyase
MEYLDRGVVALQTEQGVALSWRWLGTDPATLAFNVYRDNVRLNAAPLSRTTFYRDTGGGEAHLYQVRPVLNGIEQSTSKAGAVWKQPYARLHMSRPAAGTTPDGLSYTYSPNDISTADVDGDGAYEFIVKWNPSNAKDNSQSGYTGAVYVDAYRLDGTRLWRIDLGRNIRAGAHYTQFIAYDLDGDGRAEVAMKTADATKDGTGKVIGDANADYRTTNGYVLTGPEYLTVFNGKTGAALATTPFNPARGAVSDWGDSYGNRVDRFLAGVAYLDGVRPSLIMSRGYYTRAVVTAWDWRGGALSRRWVFDSNDGTAGNSAYQGQGAHSMTVGDVDGDGFDEIVFGAATIDHNGKGLYSTGLGHGDALHLSDLDPGRPGLEVMMVHESPSTYGQHGVEVHDAKTGQILWSISGEGKDVGRGVTMDIDPRHPGMERWASVGGLYNAKGTLITGQRPRRMNFGIWWDGDALREILDNTTIFKWDPENSVEQPVLEAGYLGAGSNNGTKATPALVADLFGDWREEVVWRDQNDEDLLIFSSPIDTDRRLVTFMHDAQYRVSVAGQNVGYNQPSHPSFFVGEGMAAPARPSIYVVGGPTEVQLTGVAQAAGPRLTWQIRNLVLKQQEVYRDDDADPSGRTRIASLDAQARTFTDRLAVPGHTYYYWIKVIDTKLQATNSAPVAVTHGTAP